MKHAVVKDLEEEGKQILETLEGKNINFLFGAGASMPYLKTLEIKGSDYTFEDIYNESTQDDYDDRISDYLSAYFMNESLYLGSYAALEEDTGKTCSLVKKNYNDFINAIINILARNSIQQPKRANIFTTNYDMFFEYAFDEISKKNTHVNFNDGSYGFVHKTVSTERFHSKIINVGVDSRFEYETPMLNLIKLHGSLNWCVDNDGLICVNNDKFEAKFSDEQIEEFNKLSEFAQQRTLKDIVHEIESKLVCNYDGFYKLINKLAIVKPTKRKFSETVFEEHHYQMLRILSQELERKQSVIIALGFSFNDEHIRSIIKRSLVNPNLLMYIVCFDEKSVDLFSDIFRDNQNVILLSNGTHKDVKGDFRFFKFIIRRNLKMEPNLDIGIVVEIDGQKVIIETNNQSNDLTYFYNGAVYRGVCVGQFIGIIRGPYTLVGRIEKEFLVDLLANTESVTYQEYRFKRRLEVKLMGYFDKGNFNLGIITYPMIYNSVIMLNDDQIERILTNKEKENEDFFIDIGKTVKEKSKVEIDVTRLFNTHIGIFGNTGSGKSNTLTKIYTELFEKDPLDLNLDKSKFLFIDFNGEYIGEKVFSRDKKVLNLSTGKSEGDKISISNESFWDIETLAILFSATEKTQKPFLKNAIDFFLDDTTHKISNEKIIVGISASFFNTFNSNSSKETNNLLHLIYDELGINSYDGEENIPLYNYRWHEVGKSYFDGGSNFVDKIKDQLNDLKIQLRNYLNDELISIIESLSTTQRMKIAIYSHLIYCISYGQVQFEYISPLVERLKSRSKIIDKLINIGDDDDSVITVVSLRKCNTEAKKIIPLLLAKNSYNMHKLINEEKIVASFHLIIDEAHNILSEQSTREETTWKDYRLETFEEIIKEGRKFGYYLTLSSQRPADISHTLVSQLHNYFLHRLVSEQDIWMINNTINTLDSVSKSNIPLLAPGQCILTGTSFSMPLIVQITKLNKDLSPNSESVDLKRLWFDETRKLD